LILLASRSHAFRDNRSLCFIFGRAACEIASSNDEILHD